MPFRVVLICLALIAAGCTGATRPGADTELAAEPSATATPAATRAPSGSTPGGEVSGARGGTAAAPSSAPAAGAPLAPSGPVRSTGENLFSAGENSIGITDTSITLC